jgi:hypothetical protein
MERMEKRCCLARAGNSLVSKRRSQVLMRKEKLLMMEHKERQEMLLWKSTGALR